MNSDVLFELYLVLLFIFSVVVPFGIYLFLYKKIAISRWTVVTFAMLLIVIAGIDVVLLGFLAEEAKTKHSQAFNHVFSGQLSLLLYLLPAAFGGLGVNLISHVLINHLNEAEEQFDKDHREPVSYFANFIGEQAPVTRALGSVKEKWLLIGGAVVAACIFILDWLAGAGIQLHVLYIFPLAVIARYCSELKVVIAALVVTITLQVITFSLQALVVTSFITDIAVALSASLLITYLARQGRHAYLVVANQAVFDSLTNLFNRRGFMADLEDEVARQKRYGGTFSLALIDLDGFKALNDSMGHTVGDNALKICASVLRSTTRRSDSIGRIGGDEFAVLMPNTTSEGNAAICRHLCQGIEESMKSAGFSVTASIGCRAFDSTPGNADQALQQTDELMYLAKRRGKNQVAHGR